MDAEITLDALIETSVSGILAEGLAPFPRDVAKALTLVLFPNSQGDEKEMHVREIGEAVREYLQTVRAVESWKIN